MSDQLYAGSLADFDTTDSMAKDMEDALRTFVGLPSNTDANAVATRRKALIALATGIITHLANHASAISVTVRDDPVKPLVQHFAAINVKP